MGSSLSTIAPYHNITPFSPFLSDLLLVILIEKLRRDYSLASMKDDDHLNRICSCSLGGCGADCEPKQRRFVQVTALLSSLALDVFQISLNQRVQQLVLAQYNVILSLSTHTLGEIQKVDGSVFRAEILGPSQSYRFTTHTVTMDTFSHSS